MNVEEGKRKLVVQKNELVGYLRKRVDELQEMGNACVVMTMGAGDIDRLVNTITKTLMCEKNG